MCSSDLVCLAIGDTTGGGESGRHGGEARNAVCHAGRADLGTIRTSTASRRRVDDQLHLPRTQELNGIVRHVTETHLGHQGVNVDALRAKEARRAHGGGEAKPEFAELSSEHETIVLVTIGEREKYLTRLWESDPRGHLSLREGDAETFADAQDRKSTRLNSSH